MPQPQTFEVLKKIAVLISKAKSEIRYVLLFKSKSKPLTLGDRFGRQPYRLETRESSVHKE